MVQLNFDGDVKLNIVAADHVPDGMPIIIVSKRDFEQLMKNSQPPKGADEITHQTKDGNNGSHSTGDTKWHELGYPDN